MPPLSKTSQVGTGKGGPPIIPYDKDELVVDIRLLHKLGEMGLLSGRSFRVLCSRAPLKVIHEELDKAFKRSPDRSELNDFRTEESRVLGEWKWLNEAEEVVTPHVRLAAILRTQLKAKIQEIPWVLRTAHAPQSGERAYLYFPGPTHSRKGVEEVQEIARRLKTPVVLGRGKTTGTGWTGVELLDPAKYPLEQARAIIMPSVWEDRPSEAMRAISAGVRVYASENVGLPPTLFSQLDGIDESFSETMVNISD